MNYKDWLGLLEKGYSSDIISLLQFIEAGEALDEDHAKTKALLSTLNRKQLISEGILTISGKELLDSLNGELVRVKKEDKFEDWWKVYPSTDAFTFNKVEFGGTQSKRIKKIECKTLFNKLINSGIEAEDIIEATRYHIESAKKLSIKKGSSQLTFIANSERYLREKMFEPYIELSKKVYVKEEMADPSKLW